MIIYNVTTKVAHSIASDWLHWIKKEHIPDVVGTGCFTHAVVLHLLDTDESEGITYAVQYHSKNKELYSRYISEFADEMRKKAIEKWGDQFIAFRSLLSIIN